MCAESAHIHSGCQDQVTKKYKDLALQNMKKATRVISIANAARDLCKFMPTDLFVSKTLLNLF